MLHPREHIIKELLNLSPSIAENEAINIYSVPNAYFEELAGKILQQIALNDAGRFLPVSKNVNPYQLPNGYFESLAHDVLQKTAWQNNLSGEVNKELETLAPFLLTISKQMPFDLPANYFNGAITKPATADSSKRPRTIIQLKQYIKYAVAATVIGIMAITAGLLTQPKSLNNHNVPRPVSITTAVQNATDNEIIDYLNKSIPVPNASALVNPTATEAKIDDWIKGASDDDIKSFLNDHQAGSVKKNKEG